MDKDALFAGITSGVCQTFIGYPFDSMKTWRQNHQLSTRPPITIRNLYKGIQFPLMQSPFTVATGFFVNDAVLSYTKYEWFCFRSYVFLLPLPFRLLQNSTPTPLNT